MELNYIGKKQHPQKKAEEHRHNCWELIYNTSGSGHMVIGEKEYPFSEGSIILCPPRTNHTKVARDTFEDLYLTFSYEELQPRVYSLTDMENREIYHILQVIYTAYYQERSFKVCNALLEALMGLIEPQLTQTVRSKYVQVLQQSIIHSFEDPAFSLEAACAQIPQNIDHLRRNFKKCMGITPHQYLTQLRIKKAKHLLSEAPERKLYLCEIANRSGFADPLYFSKVFKKWTGKTPVQWQK